MLYSEEYQLALDLVGGDVEWMEQQGYANPTELVAPIDTNHRHIPATEDIVTDCTICQERIVQ